MKVLVLGDSDSGSAIAGRGTWSAVLREQLETRLGQAVELTEMRLGPLSPTAATRAESRVRELEPDLVILPVSAYLFGMGFVWKRVERLFGKRAARWYRRLEASFESTTRARGNARERLNRIARVAIRSAVGVQPLATRDETRRAYVAVIEALTRVEDIHLLAFCYGSRTAYNRVPAVAAERRLFIADMAATAAAHRVPFLDGEDAFANVPLDVPVTTADGLHSNGLGHGILGDFIAVASAEMLAVTR